MKYLLIISVITMTVIFLAGCGDSGPSDPYADFDMPSDKDIPVADDDSVSPDSLEDDQDSAGLDDTSSADDDTVIPDADSGPELIGDWCEKDEDGDGILNCVECPELLESLTLETGKCRDTDSDGQPDFRDQYSDADGIPDNIEAPEGVPVDSDLDGIPDYLDDDSDGDGVADWFEGAEDKDEDGIPNYLDLDSDGDGWTDAEEGELVDGVPRNSDTDKLPDFLDRDSDADSLSDEKEKELGTNPYLADSDGDGFDDAAEVALGTDPLEKAVFPENVFYVSLPFEGPASILPLEFSTTIKKADVLIMVDLSPSMAGEHANLKSGIKTTIIDKVKEDIPDSAFGLVEFAGVENTVYNLAQPVTTDLAAVKTKVDAIQAINAGLEYHSLVLWRAASGGATDQTICTDAAAGVCTETSTINFAQMSACSPETSGGACFRQESLPIFIMLSDEQFFNDGLGGDSGIGEIQQGTQITTINAVNAMKSLNAKFIGLDSGDAMGDFNTIANLTGSIDKKGKNFNARINSDGSGLSDSIAAAVAELAHNINIDVNTLRKSIANPDNIDTANFITAVTPASAVPGQGTGFDHMDETTFFMVKPGTTVTFDVSFKNDFFQNMTSDTKLFRALINVMGAGTLLDTREVVVLVPGKPADIEEN